MTFHSVGNGIIPTDERIYFSEGLFYHQPGNFQLDTEIQVSPVLEELCFFLWLKKHVELVMFVDEILSRTSFVGWKYA
jgi:hypothetical protein